MLCLLGPTASGKSSLAFWLAQEIPEVEIISMDSAQIYRGMNIGTAKPTAAECAQLPHHLIDILDPAESYSAARFVNDARKAAEHIRARGKIPVIVGGTMLYFKALSEGLDDLPTVPAEIRARIAEEASAIGWPALHQQLTGIDPQTARRLNPNDAQRISRALELYRHTGESMTALIAQSAARGTRLESVCMSLACSPRIGHGCINASVFDSNRCWPKDFSTRSARSLIAEILIADFPVCVVWAIARPGIILQE